MMDGVKTDETGLHAEDCECVRCDAGYRPTRLERLAAARALTLRRAALATPTVIVPPPRWPHETWHPVKRPTKEQFEELKKLREGIGK